MHGRRRRQRAGFAQQPTPMVVVGGGGGVGARVFRYLLKSAAGDGWGRNVFLHFAHLPLDW
jgi:hypothetical protein